MEKLFTERNLENLDKTIKDIGQANTRITAPLIEETRNALLKNGYEVAEAYVAQRIGTDENTELLRVLAICKKYDLSPVAAARILDNLNRIELGKW